MLKIFWTSNCLAQPLSILNVTAIGANPRVKYITQGMFAKKLICNHSHALCVLILGPYISEISDCVDRLFLSL
jgi:hypothetical protein